MNLRSNSLLDHTEYRREAYRSVGFRRAFSEVFRSRSFLFIGSGLSEGYFENLFDEVLELQGALPHLHYALVQGGSMNLRFLRERFQIEAIEYDRHDQVPHWIGELHQGVGRRSSRALMWGFRAATCPTTSDTSTVPPDLHIVGSILPRPLKTECLVISAGIDFKGEPQFSGSGMKVLREHFPGLSLTDRQPVSEQPKVWHFAGYPVFAAAARVEGRFGRDARDARIVFDAMKAALGSARDAGFKSMHSMLLAAGKGRIFSPHVSLIQMVRAYTACRNEGPATAAGEPFRLTIHVVDPGPLNVTV
jgi:SIR2-like domain